LVFQKKEGDFAFIDAGCVILKTPIQFPLGFSRALYKASRRYDRSRICRKKQKQYSRPQGFINAHAHRAHLQNHYKLKQAKMSNKTGKFIVFYGINNLGKTTQAKMLVDHLNKKNIKAEYLKYAVYDLEPAGKLINEYLRGGNPHDFSPRELQLLHYIDRISFEPILKEKLNSGINIIAEDYFGTAIAWGAGAGVDRKLLEYLYSFVRKEDLAILFDGERFTVSVEKNHKHENDAALLARVRQVHLELGKKYNWKKIGANQPIGKIHQMIVKIVQDFFHNQEFK